MTKSEVLAIGEKDMLFYRLAEGDGSNLLMEDEEEGYVDYIMLDIGRLVDAYGYVDEAGSVDGAQIMLKELYQEKFNSQEDVIEHCIGTEFIPDQPYRIVTLSKNESDR